MSQVELARWSEIAFSPCILKRSVSYAIVVGFLLILINHGPCVLDDMFTRACFLQSVLSVIVPYLVVTASSVQATIANGKKM